MSEKTMSAQDWIDKNIQTYPQTDESLAAIMAAYHAHELDAIRKAVNSIRASAIAKRLNHQEEPMSEATIEAETSISVCDAFLALLDHKPHGEFLSDAIPTMLRETRLGDILRPALTEPFDPAKHLTGWVKEHDNYWNLYGKEGFFILSRWDSVSDKWRISWQKSMSIGDSTLFHGEIKTSAFFALLCGALGITTAPRGVAKKK